MPIAITEEQRAVQDSIRDWATGSGTADIRALEPGLETGSQPWHGSRRWKELAGIGVFSIAVSEANGGAGGGIADLAAALEQTADALVPGPLLTTAVAGVLLDRAGAPGFEAELQRIVGGEISVGMALDPGTLVAVDGADGRTHVSGRAELVIADANTSHVLLPARISGESGEIWFLLETDQLELTEQPALDFSRPLAQVGSPGVEIGQDNRLPDLVAGQARDLAVTLAAAESSGVAGWCLRTAVEYAGVREQFGRAIGSFQAVKHLCAEMLCRVEQAGSLAWNAARALDEGAGEHPLAIATAGATVFDAAFENAKDCIQVLGGTGFTWEHDAHLYLRRATATRQLFGSAAMWHGRVTDLALGGARRSLGIGAGEISEEVESRRPAIRADIERIATLEPSRQREQLAESGYLAPQWPEPHGHDASPSLQLLIDEELENAGVRRPDLVIGGWAAPTILRYGTDAQKERFVRPTLRGQITWCQLFSEPGAGSDLAALRTLATREDGGWRLTGQKVWTSVAREADWAICLARTDVDAPQHRGITYFLVDMRSPGIQVRPLREITGDAVFNEVFLDGVFVPDDGVVGEVNGGWRIARATLANERVAISGGSALGSEVERVLDRVRQREPGDTSDVRERTGALVAQGLAVSLLSLRATLRQLRGQGPGPESSVAKLVGVRHRQDAAELGLDLLGSRGAAVEDDSAEVLHQFLNTRCLSIAGGTTQILRTLVAERILGLPRESSR